MYIRQLQFLVAKYNIVEILFGKTIGAEKKVVKERRSETDQ